MTYATALPSFSFHGFSFVINKFFERRITIITTATAGTITTIAGTITNSGNNISKSIGIRKREKVEKTLQNWRKRRLMTRILVFA